MPEECWCGKTCEECGEDGGCAWTRALHEARVAEGERIARLADRTGAVATSDEGTSCYFSALIREGAG